MYEREVLSTRRTIYEHILRLDHALRVCCKISIVRVRETNFSYVATIRVAYFFLRVKEKQVQTVDNSLQGGRGWEYNDCNDMEYIRTTKIIKTGNSLCLVLPNNILKSLNMARGDQMSLWVYDIDTIVIRRITPEDLQNLKPKNI